MKQEELFIEPFIPDYSEFEGNEEQHTFSEEYVKNKKTLLRNYRKSMLAPASKRFVKVAAVVLALVVASPLAVNAATNGEFFRRIWGTDGKEDIASHDEVLYDAEKDKEIVVTYPKREYEDIDVELVQEQLEDKVYCEPIVEQIGDHTLTILSAIYDGNAAVVEFTLEREGGVTALNYSQLDNEAKGAWFSDESDFWFCFTDAGEHIYVDLEKSTEDKLYCYDYIGFDGRRSSVSLEIREYPCKREEFITTTDDEKMLEIDAGTTVKNISIPLTEAVASVEYVNPSGGLITISPMSITIDMKTGLNLETTDPWELYYVSINYKDGTSYLVQEHEKYQYFDDGTEKLIHSVDVEINNTSYGLGRLNGEMLYVFNRLVDLDEIESITINEVTYQLKK